MKLVRCTRCKHHWIEWRSGQSCPKCTTRFDLTPPPLPEVTAEVTAPRPPDQFQHQNQCTNCGTCSTGFNYCPTCGGINVPLINGRPIPRGPSSRPVCQICHRGRLVSKSRFKLGGSGGCLGLLVMIPAAIFLLFLAPFALVLAPLVAVGALVFLLLGGTLAQRKRMLQCTSCGAVVPAS